MTTEDGKAVSYRYNGDNLMVERTEGGVTTRYYYDDRAKIMAEGKLDGDGSITITASYVHDDYGKLLARQVPGQGMQYYVSNGHGDITEIRDAQGNVLNRYTYDIWGNPLVQEERVPNIFRYSGEYWDSATKLQYLRARWYDPSIGRFINEDTYEGELGNPLTMNLYTYVQNNPLKYIDPSGNRYIPSDMNSILEATMKITSTESKAYSYAYNLLSREYADVYDNNRFNYLFGLLTQTSAYKNSAGNADWARAELAKDYSEWHQEISFAEALASLGPIIGGIGKAREVGGKVRANKTTKWDIKTNAKAKVTYKFNGDTITAYQDNTKKGYWWAKDTTGHGGSAFKVFERRGNELHWFADADEYGNFIKGKHKSLTGTVIKLR